MNKSFLVLLSFCGFLLSCNDSHQELQTSQDNICVASSLADIRANCNNGELLYFEPNNWGNEQLPMMITALACNTNKPVYFNKAGVVCTYYERKSVNGKLLSGDKAESSQAK